MSNDSASPRVALFSPRFVPSTQTFIYEETSHYQRYQADIFTRFRMNEDEFPFAPVYALASERGPRYSPQSFLYRTTTISPRFFRQLASKQYAIVHGLFGRSAVNALPYHRAFKLPLIVTFRGEDAAILVSRKRVSPPHVPYWLTSKILFRSAERFLTVSEDLAERLLRAGADPAKVHVWHSGVVIPPEVERPPRSTTTILTVGRFVEKKGIDYAIETFARLARDRQDVALRIIGDGPPRPEYERLAARSGAGSRISFLGMVSHAALREQLSQADILFAPSVAPKDDTEGVPTVMMEANARSVPVVASRVGGIPDIIEDQRTGLLLPERDVQAFVEALRLLTTDSARRIALGRAARAKMMREHNLVDRMAVLESHYDQAIAAYKSRA